MWKDQYMPGGIIFASRFSDYSNFGQSISLHTGREGLNFRVLGRPIQSESRIVIVSAGLCSLCKLCNRLRHRTVHNQNDFVSAVVAVAAGVAGSTFNAIRGKLKLPPASSITLTWQT